MGFNYRVRPPLRLVTRLTAPEYRQGNLLRLPDTNMSTDESGEPLPSIPKSGLRRGAPSEIGEVRSSSPGTSIKPLASEIHPERMARLRDPTPEACPPPVKFQTRTKSNCLAMPFNRLERCQQQAYNPASSMRVEGKVVNSFLQSLEPMIPVTPRSSQWYRRSSPQSDMQTTLSPTRRQLQDDLEWYGLQTDVGAGKSNVTDTNMESL
jgi:hypothetical protein